MSEWRPSAGIDALRARADLLARARAWFADTKTLEVETPMLCDAPVTDVNIDSLRVHSGVLDRQWYLHTSPEYAMKRLLCAGCSDIYQIGKVFRDGELGHRHQIEFTMIEWYRLGFGLDAMVDDTLSLLQALLGRNNAPIIRHTYDDALRAALGLDSDCDISELQNLVGDNFPRSLINNKDALLDWLFDQHVARGFVHSHITIIDHYPASQAALAKISPDTNRALRFEIYHGAMEVANGFVELQDVDEQRSRFARDNQARENLGKFSTEPDEKFLQALTAGLPACAGVAVGLDRLLMLAQAVDTIADVTSFAHI